jgi:hypothetical protein
VPVEIVVPPTYGAGHTERGATAYGEPNDERTEDRCDNTCS